MFVWRANTSPGAPVATFLSLPPCRFGSRSPPPSSSWRCLRKGGFGNSKGCGVTRLFSSLVPPLPILLGLWGAVRSTAHKPRDLAFKAAILYTRHLPELAYDSAVSGYRQIKYTGTSCLPLYPRKRSLDFSRTCTSIGGGGKRGGCFYLLLRPFANRSSSPTSPFSLTESLGSASRLARFQSGSYACLLGCKPYWVVVVSGLSSG